MAYVITQIDEIPTSVNCISSAVNESGSVQAIIGLNGTIPTIYVSVDFGSSFTEVSPTSNNYTGTPVDIDVISFMYQGLEQNLLVFSIGSYVFKTIFNTIASIVWSSTQINAAYNVGGISIGSAVDNSPELYVFANCANNPDVADDPSAVSNANFFYRSNDSGTTWMHLRATNEVTTTDGVVPVPTTQYIAAANGAVDGVPAAIVYATGNNGQIWISGDRGDNWLIIQVIKDPQAIAIPVEAAPPGVTDNRVTKPTTLLNKSMTINTGFNGNTSILAFGTNPTATYTSVDVGKSYVIGQSTGGVLLFGNTAPIGLVNYNGVYFLTVAYTDQSQSTLKFFNTFTNGTTTFYPDSQDSQFLSWSCVDLSNFGDSSTFYMLAGTNGLGAFTITQAI